MNIITLQQELQEKGYSIIKSVFTAAEIENIIATIDSTISSKPTFRKSTDLFAIRQFLKEIPDVQPLLINEKMKGIIFSLFGSGYFPVKSIYFDKPGNSNWFVSYHQDLTISVNTKKEIEGFGPWTVKQDQFAVQPPLHILESNFTIRIHLDDADENNGALRVIPGSHKYGIYRSELIDWSKEKEEICNVERGGVMIMKPLLLHASSRTINNKQRRVAHIEFSNQKLPQPLQWSEAIFGTASAE